jgi:hypothetical protein
MVASEPKRTVALSIALLLGGCGTLPSLGQVERDFRRDHPDYTIDSSRYRIEGSYEANVRQDEAVFQINYRKPNDPQPHTFERRFGNAAEGWFEVPSKGPE